MTRLQMVTLTAWLLFVPYYFFMKHWEQTVIAPIRIDLLLIYPVLGLLTLAVLIQWLKRRYQNGNSKR
ncbi:hypothetical protein [Psychrobacter ciconiae]|uniref:hypothetical protein n=1 Tax=Psychrobacter ciconiae TaxID=1553449 RepID=UPI0019185ADB|nr:hypothetical protein [Psychrobacter ciconiae]